MSQEDLQLTERYQTKILEKSQNINSFKSEETKMAVEKITESAKDRDANGVADGYKELRSVLHSGAEDDSFYGASITRGTKKRLLKEFMHYCNIVYGHVYPNEDLGTTTAVNRSVVIES